MNANLESKIRTIRMNPEDLRTMSGIEERQAEFENEHIYLRTLLFGDPRGYFRIPRELPMLDSTTLALPHSLCMDYHDNVRGVLAEYIDGLDDCVLQLITGEMLAQPRNGVPVFDSQPAATAKHLLAQIVWPKDKEPSYDSAPDSKLSQELGLVYCLNVAVGANDFASEDTGYDILVLPFDNLPPAIRESIVAWTAFKHEVLAHTWRDFELHRAYYRNQFARLEPNYTSLGIVFEYHDDYMSLVASDSKMSRMACGQERHVFCKCWYDKDGLEILSKVDFAIAPVKALAMMYGLLQ